MAASLVLKVAAALALLCCSVSANIPIKKKDPWPKCQLQYNWYWCQKQPGGLIFCELTVVRNTGGPLAVSWVPTNNTDEDWGYALNCINFQGVIKCSLRFCSNDELPLPVVPWDRSEHEHEHWNGIRCKKNWYHCKLKGDRTICNLYLCPRSPLPLLPKTGKESDWYTCTWNGVQVDCFLSNLSTRKIRWRHGKVYSGKQLLTPVIPPEIFSKKETIVEEHDVHVDEAVDGHVDGPKPGYVDEHLDGLLEGHYDGHFDGLVDGHLDGYSDGHYEKDGYGDSHISIHDDYKEDTY